MEIKYTTNSDLWNNSKFKTIQKNLDLLFKSTGNQFFFGNCVSSCEIIQQILSQEGLKCKIVECQVSVIKNGPNDEKQFFFVGYDGNSIPGQIDTHTIIVVEDEYPILIDVSIGYVFLPDQRVVIEKINSIKNDSNLIATFAIENFIITYKEKTIVRLPSIHQKSLIQRFISEQQTEKTVKFLKFLVVIAVGLGVVNFILNILLIFIRLYDIKWVG